MILSKAVIGDDAAFDFDMMLSKASLIYRAINFLENTKNNNHNKNQMFLHKFQISRIFFKLFVKYVFLLYQN